MCNRHKVFLPWKPQTGKPDLMGILLRGIDYKRVSNFTPSFVGVTRGEIFLHDPHFRQQIHDVIPNFP
jgi:hypothetical protein